LGVIAKSEGKRIVRQLGTVAGAWLAGLYDQDKGVAKAAFESVKFAFGEDKVDKFWQIYQEKILDYCRTVIFHETAHTLSDERYISPDDSASKYSRVISTAIAAVSHLLGMVLLSRRMFTDLYPIKKISTRRRSTDTLLLTRRCSPVSSYGSSAPILTLTFEDRSTI
jgi:hypothetical protein